MNASATAARLAALPDGVIFDSSKAAPQCKRSRLRTSNLRAPTHPIETGRYFLLTPMILDCLNHVFDHIDHRDTGFPIVGPQRMGKTYYIGAARRYLAVTKPWLPVINLRAVHTTNVSKREFFISLLRQLHYQFFSANNSAVLLDTFSSLLAQRANEKQSDCILMFIDDAQKLTENQYKWLCDVFNDIDEEGVTLITFLVGEPLLKDYTTSIEQGEERQVSGRFFNGGIRFYGVTSIKDISACLSAYDGARFPKKQGPTFTQKYFCEAFANGWRLQTLTDLLWEAFAAVAGVSPNDALEIPMQYFCSLVRRILIKFGPGSGPEPQITRRMLEEEIILSGFQSYRP